ncbi:MAG: HIT domain-containing protein [Nitrosarchaeum sp.]
MNYKDLYDFLEHKMNMQHVYQPLMIKTLLESGNQATVEDIARVFLGDDQSQIDYYKIITKNMPGKVLQRHKIVDYKDDKFYLLLDSVSAEQKKNLIKLCIEKLAEFQVKRGTKIWQHRATDRIPISGSLQYDVFAKAKGRCMACGISRGERALDVDHIIPRNKGGKTEISNLQALCYKCNSQKRDRDNTDFEDWQEKFKIRKSGCIFCKEQKTLLENELATAFFDKFPVTALHTLIVPKRHAETFFDLIPSEKNHCFDLLDKVKEKLLLKDKTISGFNVGFNSGADSGQTVMHCHIHVIPRRKGDVLDPTGGIRNIIPGKGNYAK